MAEFRYRYPENVPGKFYTDTRCLDCDFCREMAPSIFRRDDTRDSSYVYKQPATPEELRLCEACISHCPCEAIGDDGDQYDWNEPIAEREVMPPEIEQRTKKPRWRIW